MLRTIFSFKIPMHDSIVWVLAKSTGLIKILWVVFSSMISAQPLIRRAFVNNNWARYYLLLNLWATTLRHLFVRRWKVYQLDTILAFPVKVAHRLVPRARGPEGLPLVEHFQADISTQTVPTAHSIVWFCFPSKCLNSHCNSITAPAYT